MATYRVEARFDLHIEDEAKARQVAAEIIRTITQAHLAAGGIIETAGESPEVTTHGLIQQSEAAAAAIASQMLINAAVDISWVGVSDVQAVAVAT